MIVWRRTGLIVTLARSLTTPASIEPSPSAAALLRRSAMSARATCAARPMARRASPSRAASRTGRTRRVGGVGSPMAARTPKDLTFMTLLLRREPAEPVAGWPGFAQEAFDVSEQCSQALLE